MTIEEVANKLKKKYPKGWFTVEGDTIRSGEGSYANDDYDLFNYWSMEWVVGCKYEMGVYKELAEFVGDLGYHWEAVNAGTHRLYKD